MLSRFHSPQGSMVVVHITRFFVIVAETEVPEEVRSCSVSAEAFAEVVE
jgi:hypothetical protein